MSEERDLLIQTVRDLVGKHAGPEAVRAAMDSEAGYDEKLWQLLCEQVGVAALVVPEELGGAGGELGDAAAVLTELGRNLVPTPLLGTILAELALLSAENPDASTLELLASGEATGAAVFDAGYVINGSHLDQDADVVVTVQDGQLVRLTEFTTHPAITMDPTRRLARLDGGQSAVIGPDPGLAETAALLLAAEAVGAATRALELTVAYSKERVQFGRPIGSFQALKHRMADLYVKVQTAGAVVDEALAEPSPAAAALAFVVASEAFTDVAGEAIQIHGGIAITAEHDIQLYFKRAHGTSQLLGPVREHLRKLESEVLSMDAELPVL